MLLDKFESAVASVAAVDGLVEMTLLVARAVCRGTSAALLVPRDDAGWEGTAFGRHARRVVDHSARPTSPDPSTDGAGVIDIPILAGDTAIAWLRVEGPAVTSPRVVDRLRRCGQALAGVLQAGIEPRRGGHPDSNPAPRAWRAQARER